MYGRSFKPLLTNGQVADGYSLTSTSNNFTTTWIPVSGASGFSANIVFTGNAPQGNITLEQCNDMQDSRLQPVQPLLAGGQNSFTNGNVGLVASNAPVPPGTGQAAVAVTTAGTYVLNQFLIPYAWVRIVYVATSSVNTQLDIFCTTKHL